MATQVSRTGFATKIRRAAIAALVVGANSWGVAVAQGSAESAPGCIVLRSLCIAPDPRTDLTSTYQCRSAVKMHEDGRVRAPILPTVTACLGPDRAARLVTAAQQESTASAAAAQQQLAKRREMATRPDRDGVAFFGFELGTFADVQACNRQTITARSETCAVAVPSGDGRWQNLELNFSPAELPGFIARSGWGTPYVDVRLRLVNGATEGMSFSIKYPLRAEVVEAIDRKLGPHEEKAVPMQNNAGASWDGVSYEWNRGETSASISCLEFRPATCGVSVFTKTLDSAAEKSNHDEATKGRKL
jgi:hypothetical protein